MQQGTGPLYVDGAVQVIVNESTVYSGDISTFTNVAATEGIYELINTTEHTGLLSFTETAGKFAVNGHYNVVATDEIGNEFYTNNGFLTLSTEGKYALTVEPFYDENLGLYYEVEDGQVTIVYTDWQVIMGDFVIPDTIDGFPVTSLVSGAFDNCNKLTSLTIPAGVVSIVDRWDMGGIYLGSHIEHIKIFVDSENPVYHSDGNCFIETAAKKIIQGFDSSVIPSDGSVTTISAGAFAGCSGLKNIIIPNDITAIEAGAFNSSGLTNITVPGSVTEIGPAAFGNCPDLVYVTIEDGVTSISANAFNDCPKLKSITIPASVTTIGASVLDAYCESFETVYYEGTSEQWSSIAVGDDNEVLTSAHIVYLSAHSWVLDSTHPASCLDDGRVVYVCSDSECAETWVIPISAHGHSFVDEFCEHCGIFELVAPYDFNRDCVLDTSDLLELQSVKISLMICFLSDYRDILLVYPEMTYDLNDDGESNIRDLVHLKKRIMQYPIYN